MLYSVCINARQIDLYDNIWPYVCMMFLCSSLVLPWNFIRRFVLSSIVGSACLHEHFSTFHVTVTS